jgi:hypothetical protein
MAYSIKTIERVKNGPRFQLGNQLGRLAVDKDLSVMRIAKATGATRQTVYNWMLGGEVIGPYKSAVERVVAILKATPTAEKAWSQICQDFNLQA